jgi:hypothetical protein
VNVTVGITFKLQTFALSARCSVRFGRALGYAHGSGVLRGWSFLQIPWVKVEHSDTIWMQRMTRVVAHFLVHSPFQSDVRSTLRTDWRT